MELLTFLKYLGFFYLALFAPVVLCNAVTRLLIGINYGGEFWLDSQEWRDYWYQKKYLRSESNFARSVGEFQEGVERYALAVLGTLPKAIGLFSSVTVLWVAWKIIAPGS